MPRTMQTSTRRRPRPTSNNNTSNSAALMAIQKAIRSENEYRSAIKKINANAMVLADTLSLSGHIEQALLDTTDSNTQQDAPSQDQQRVSRKAATAAEEKRKNELFLDEQRMRLKALVAKNITSERNVDAFVEAVTMVKTEVVTRQQKRQRATAAAAGGADGESDDGEEGREESPNYEEMIQNKMKALKRDHEQNGIDMKDESLMRKCRERLNEKDDQAEEDEELEVMDQPGGAESESALKCPFTLKMFVKPFRNKICQHVFEYDAIIHHLGSSRRCPVYGCTNSQMTATQLEEDVEMQMKVRRKNRRDEEKKQKLHRDRDEEDEYDDEGENFGTTVID